MTDKPINSGPRAPASEVAEAASGRPLLDFEHLARYTFGDRKLEREIIELFLEQAAKSIGDLERAVTDKDWHIAAHTLKGSSRAVGALTLADVAAEAERLGGVANREACARMTAALRKAEGSTKAFIQGQFKAA